MIKKNKLIEKLIRAAGGWEKFLYQTLKEVCEDVRPTVVDAGVTSDVLEEARTVVCMWEEKERTGEPDAETVQPVPLGKTQATAKVEADDSAKSSQPDKFESHKSVEAPKPVPESFTMRIRVDEEVGGAQGELPLPQDFKITRRELLNVTTKDGLFLGGGSGDGQVRGSGVSGHISTYGKYRLVFKDNKLGVACIRFEATYSPAVSKIDKEADDKRTAEIQQALSLHKTGSISPVSMAAGLRQVESVDAERLDKIKAEIG